MSKYAIYFKPSAEKELLKMDPEISRRVEEKIDLLENNPYLSGFTRLKGEPTFRIRVGDFRIVYAIDESNKTITIFRIRHRSEVYKR